jgi:hypothetical protein
MVEEGRGTRRGVLGLLVALGAVTLAGIGIIEFGPTNPREREQRADAFMARKFDEVHSNDEFTVYRIPTTKFSYDSAEVREAYISGKIPRNSRTTLSFIQPYADEGHTLREQFLRDYDLKKNASKAGFK